MSDSRIRKIRKANKLSGTKVAERLGISPQHYYDIERGENGLSAENAVKLAEIFDVTLDYLLGHSTVALIESRLAELNMSMKELAETTSLPRAFLESLDSLPPAPWDYEKGELIDKIAKSLNMDGKKLSAAFARQEPPGYDGPSDTRSIEEIFENEPFDGVMVKEKSAAESYGTNNETNAVNATLLAEVARIAAENGYNLHDPEFFDHLNKALAFVKSIRGQNDN